LKVSEINIGNLKSYCHIDYEDDDSILEAILASVKMYIKKYTGLEDETIENLEDLSIVVLVLSKDLYDNKTYSMQSSQTNPIVQSILDMHSINLL